MRATADRHAHCVLCLLAVLLLGGCQSRPAAASAPPVPFKLNKSKSVEFTPADEEFGQRRVAAESEGRTRNSKSKRTQTEMTEGELYELPKFTVSRKGFLNFGLSVVTNTEVLYGGNIEWMRVGVVLPGSSAAREGLYTGIEIMAIDKIPVSYLSREDMLHKFFEREPGDVVRLLVYSRHYGPLPRFVTLEGTARSRK